MNFSPEQLYGLFMCIVLLFNPGCGERSITIRDIEEEESVNIFIFLSGSASKSAFYKDHFHRIKKNGDTVICADGGYAVAASIKIRPDVIIGDLDSLDPDQIEEGIEVARFPEKKNFSDFELALKRAVRMSPEKIWVYGALGGRPDHEVINILLLAYAEIPVVFVEENVEFYNVRRHLMLEGKKGCTCTLLALSGGCRVREMKGFSYQLTNEMLLPSSRGLSNVIIEEKASIRLEEGSLIVIVIF